MKNYSVTTITCAIMARIIRSLRRENGIWKNTKGYYIVEYAFALPLFLAFVFSCVEYSLMAFADVQLNSGLFALSRLIKTGQFNSGLSSSATQSQINAAIKNDLQSLLVPSYIFHSDKLKVNTEVFSDYSSIGTLEHCINSTPEPCNNNSDPLHLQYDDANSDNFRDLLGGTAGSGNGGNIVLYSASYQWEGITPVWHIMNYLVGSNNAGGTTLNASILLKSEPFPTTSR